jgi:hypothetical protein
LTAVLRVGQRHGKVSTNPGAAVMLKKLGKYYIKYPRKSVKWPILGLESNTG